MVDIDGFRAPIVHSMPLGAPAANDKGGRKIAPDDGGGFDTAEAFEQTAPESQRSWKPGRVDIAKGNKLAVEGQGLEHGLENPLLGGRQHVAPGQPAHDAVRPPAIHVFGKVLRRVVDDVATGPVAAQDGDMGRVDFHGKKPAVLPFKRFRIGLVKAPLPGPSSTTRSPGLMSQQSTTTRESALELGPRRRF